MLQRADAKDYRDVSAMLEDNLLHREIFETHCKPSVVTPYTNFLGGPVFLGQVTRTAYNPIPE